MEEHKVTKEKVIQFLREKEILKPDYTEFLVKWNDGRKFDFVNIIADFSNQENKQLKEEKKELIDFLEQIQCGFQWDADNKPERMDKADYEKLDELNELLKRFIN